MKFKTKYKLCLWKGYFEKGYAITSYIKYIIVLLGFYSILSNVDIIYISLLMAIYGLSCFFIGWGWYHFKWIEAEIEVNNNFNLFVKEMRNVVCKSNMFF